ncbi:hypothetical protein NM688_g1441 [Phlebia brevispora]|uniref:Uncharacterized protein n=1 Tax=Phlebia brevispora TaxID=194682 RepID=A0ACC1TBH2_9APHY|nr:hypothetical protein NM688_g1441 [Phlebia brevispora]
MSADCDACWTGMRHEGEAEGVIEKIGGIDCYVATPKGDYPKDKCPAVFAPQWNGIKTVMPDILNGDPIVDFNDPAFDRQKWLAAHGPESWEHVVDKVVAALKETGVTRFGTTGYCFGAPPAFYLAYKNESQVTVLAHPSRLQVPEDLEKYKSVSKAPLLINSCEVDSQFPPESQAIADKILGGGQFAPGYERTYWDGCTHGFAVRGDLSNPKIKAGKEGAFSASVKFFKKYL